MKVYLHDIMLKEFKQENNALEISRKYVAFIVKEKTRPLNILLNKY